MNRDVLQPARANIRALAGIFKLRIGEIMTSAQKLNCDQCCDICTEMCKCCDELKTLGKIDWSKLLTLLMQLLPLILGFFAQKDEPPQV